VEVQVLVLVKVDLAVELVHTLIILVEVLAVVILVVQQRITVLILKAAVAVHLTVGRIK
jgi:hypothetical protein